MNRKKKTFYENYGKRVLDLIFSIVALIILFPFLLIISIIIKFDSKGPVFFKQERIGLNGKIFIIYKFRTMVENAENIGTGVIVNTDKDSRITHMGKFLRRLSIDELPQLFNVLNGSMSIVGPRPPVTYHPYDGYENYPEWAKKRFLIKPGITGLAQIVLRNSVSWDERFIYDIKYADKLTFFTDIKIIIGTIFAVFNSKSLYKEGNF